MAVIKYYKFGEAKQNDEIQEYVPHRRVGRPLLRWTDPIGMSEY